MQLGLCAAAGMVGAHHLAYLLASGDRARVLLDASGHGYWGEFAPFALAAGVAALADACMAAARSRPERGSRLAPTARRLAPMQVAAFVALEIVERVVVCAGHGASTLAIDPRPVLLGVLVQAALAVVGALVLTGVRRIVSRLGRRRPASTAGPAPLRPRAPLVVRHLLLGAGGRTLRGPPRPRLA